MRCTTRGCTAAAPAVANMPWLHTFMCTPTTCSRSGCMWPSCDGEIREGPAAEGNIYVWVGQIRQGVMECGRDMEKEKHAIYIKKKKKITSIYVECVCFDASYIYTAGVTSRYLSLSFFLSSFFISFSL